MANFWRTVSATAGLLVNFGHTLSAMAVPATTALAGENRSKLLMY